MCHPNDVDIPSYYNIDSIPPEVTWQNYRKPIFNSGKYVHVLETSTFSVYFYAFLDTIAASDATYSDLELSFIAQSCGEVEAILPICPPTSPKFTAFKSPENCYVEPDVLIVVEEGRKEGIEEGVRIFYESLSSRMISNVDQSPSDIQQVVQQVYHEIRHSLPSHSSLPTPDATPPPPNEFPPANESPLLPSSKGELLQLMNKLKLKSPENVANKAFIRWLKNNLGNEFVVSADEQSSTTHYYSRFSRSRQDFNFFHSSCGMNGKLDAVAFSELDYFEVEAAAGDCKLSSKSSDIWQLIANMVKTAADVAYAAVKQDKLFIKITVYGFLVDYKEAKAKELHKLTFDFKEGGQRPTLIKCESGDLQIEDAAERSCALLKQSIAVLPSESVN